MVHCLLYIARLDGALQNIFPINLFKEVLCMEHYPRLQGHPDPTSTLNSLGRKFYWRFMANDDFDCVKDSQLCAEARGTLTK